MTEHSKAASIPGPDPGVCPKCGEWMKAGMRHTCMAAYDGWCGIHGHRNVDGCPGCPGREPEAAYRTIVADPPWNVLRPAGGTWTGGRGGNRPQPYPTMTLEEIAALPVASWAHKCCHLYLWTVNKYVTEAYDIARAWGFEPATLLVWAKEPVGKGPGGLFSITTEFVLYARRGPEPRRMVVPTSWWSWPRRGQSVKPEAFYDLVEEISYGPYLEMFARRQRLGWDTWGNEALEHVELSA